MCKGIQNETQYVPVTQYLVEAQSHVEIIEPLKMVKLNEAIFRCFQRSMISVRVVPIVFKVIV